MHRKVVGNVASSLQVLMLMSILLCIGTNSYKDTAWGGRSASGNPQQAEVGESAFPDGTVKDPAGDHGSDPSRSKLKRFPAERVALAGDGRRQPHGDRNTGLGASDKGHSKSGFSGQRDMVVPHIVPPNPLGIKPYVLSPQGTHDLMEDDGDQLMRGEGSRNNGDDDGAKDNDEPDYSQPDSSAKSEDAELLVENNAGLPRADDDHLYPEPSAEYTSFTPSKPPRPSHSPCTNPSDSYLDSTNGIRMWQSKRDMSPGSHDDWQKQSWKDAEQAYLKGDMCLDKRDYDGAAAAYVRALEIDPFCPDALARLGSLVERSQHPQKSSAHLLYQKGHFHDCVEDDADKAEELYKKALSASPNDPIALNALGCLLHNRKKDYSGAESLFSQASGLQPNNPNMLHDYIRALIQQNKLTAAETILRKATKLDPSHAPLLFTWAHVRVLQHNDHDGAVNLAQRAISINPVDPMSLCSYAFVLATAKEEYDVAETHYKAAMALIPSDAIVYRELAQLLQMKGGARRAEVRGLYEKAMELRPTEPQLLCQYARFMQEEGDDLQKIEDTLDDAIEQSPDDALILNAYALFLSGPGLQQEESHTQKEVNRRRAADFFSKAAKLRPFDSSIHFNLGAFMQVVRREYDAAQTSYLRAIECEPGNAEYHFRLAHLAHYHLRDHHTAEKEYQACLSAEPAHVEALAHLGILLCNAFRRYASAKRILDRVQQLDPEHEDANLIRKFLSVLELAQKEGRMD